MTPASHRITRRHVFGLLAALPAWPAEASASVNPLADRTAGGPKDGAGSDTVALSTLTGARGRAVDAGVDIVCTLARAVLGDGGGARYRRVPEEPAHPGKFRSADTGQWWEIDEPVLSLAMFGYKADGVMGAGGVATGTDDTAAWRECIETAAAQGRSIIQVPWGATGKSVCAGSIVDGALPTGLQFVATGTGPQPYPYYGTSIVYTRAGALWDIHPGDDGNWGHWRWKDLTFVTTHPAGSVFDFSRLSLCFPVDDGRTIPADGGRFPVFLQASWENCTFLGKPWSGINDPGKTGDAIRGFHLYDCRVDHACYFRGWRRALWLDGCDNMSVAGRFEYSGRHVHQARRGTGGNNLLIDARFMGGSMDCGEDRYMVWDTGSSTRVFGMNPEANDLLAAAIACAYINGQDGRYDFVPQGTVSTALFRIGPDARTFVIDAPVDGVLAGWAPIIDRPRSWDVGLGTTGYYGWIITPSLNLQALLRANPRAARCRLIGAASGWQSKVDPRQAMTQRPDGVFPRRFTISGSDYWGRSAGTVADGGIGDLVTDTSASQNVAIHLDHHVAQPGFGLGGRVGEHFSKSRHKVTLRSRGDGEGWQLLCLQGGRRIGSIRPGADAGYATVACDLDLTRAADGDLIEIYVAADRPPTADLYVDFLDVAIVEAPVASPSLSAPSANELALKGAVDGLIAAARAAGLLA